jgi:hypothetical protein
MIRRSCREVGLGLIYPDQRRHSFAHAGLASGGNGGDLVRWRDGDRARCFIDMPRRLPMNAFESPID